MAESHPLHEDYLDALYELPDELRARRALEDELAAQLTSGKHVCIRGFWRIGKTTLMRGVLQNAVQRTGGVAFSVDLRNPDTQDGMVKTPAELLGRIAAKVTELLKRAGATELTVDPKQPLQVLGELAAPIFVGLDELIALFGLEQKVAREVLENLLATPKNVKVVAVCHRHRDLDELFESAVVAKPSVVTRFVPPISDEELVHLINTPALARNVRFSDEGLGSLAVLSGNRPWELVSLAALATATLEKGFTGEIGPEKVEALFDLEALGASEEGQALVDNVLRIVMTAMNAEEKALVDLLVTGGEGEASADAVRRLGEAGLVVEDEEGLAVNGALFEGLARAVATGEIKVSVE